MWRRDKRVETKLRQQEQILRVHVQPGRRGHRPDRYRRAFQSGQQSILRDRPASGGGAAADADSGSDRSRRPALPARSAGARDRDRQRDLPSRPGHVLPDGSRLWMRNNVSAILDQSGAVRHFMAVVEDVTARRRAEESLQRAHDDLQKARRRAHGDASRRPPKSCRPRSSTGSASRPRSSTTSPSAARRKRR